jgi:type IV pilus assembly protein PilM
MFEFIKGGKNKFIGVDFGTSSIKVIELVYKNQRSYLENYGVVELNLELQANQRQLIKNQSFEQKLNIALKSLLEKMKITSGSAYVSIPGFSGLITIIELPEMKEEELGRAMQFEAHKYIPTSLDEVAMSWEVINHEHTGKPVGPEDASKNKTIKVLLVAAPKRDIERYDRLISGTGLSVSAIELETFPIARALVREEVAPFLIIDIGARSTNMILVHNGSVCVNRTIDTGGSDITSAISDSMNISRNRAESFKKGDKDLLNSTDTPIVMPSLELITGESHRIMDAYVEKNKGCVIGGVILSGGTAKMKGMVEYFSRNLNMKVTLGDPWKDIVVDAKAAAPVKEIGISFSVAIGLALRGVDDYKRK